MTPQATELITLEDGRKFPQFEGKPLSWSIGLYHTIAEANIGYPKMRAVIRAMREYRPEQLTMTSMPLPAFV